MTSSVMFILVTLVLQLSLAQQVSMQSLSKEKSGVNLLTGLMNCFSSWLLLSTSTVKWFLARKCTVNKVFLFPLFPIFLSSYCNFCLP